MKKSMFLNGNNNNKNLFTDSHLMYEYAKKLNDKVEVYEMELEKAIQFCKKRLDFISFVIGSFYVYDDVKKIV